VDDLSLAVIALRNGFTENDVRSIVGCMPDTNVRLNNLDERGRRCPKR
jgi:hypothetical protein